MKINQDGELVEGGLVELKFTIPASYMETAEDNSTVCIDEKIDAEYIELADLVKLCTSKDGSIVKELLKTKVWVGRYFETNFDLQ